MVKMLSVHPSDESHRIISSRQSPRRSAVRLGVFLVLLHVDELP